MTLRILFVGGVGRSGSSLVERLLDTHPDSVSLGEIHQIFSTWIQFDKRQYCGCGEQFQDCPFWTEVMERSLGSMADFDPAEWSRRRGSVVGDKHRLQLLTELGSKEYFSNLDAFLKDIEKFYRAIQDVSGAKVIVDSSKTANWALALQRIPGFEVRFLHFVRNPYATAYSWQRKKKMPEVWWEDRNMPIYSASEIGKRWRRTYVVSRLAASKFTDYRRVHYEEFVKDPAGVLDSIVEFAGLSPFPTPPIGADGSADIHPGHTVMGNPMRVDKHVTIRNDDEWKKGLSASDMREVNRYVWPLRQFFRA